MSDPRDPRLFYTGDPLDPRYVIPAIGAIRISSCR